MVMTDRRKKPDKEKPKKKRGDNEFIEKTETVQEASTEKNTIYREALILLKDYKCQRQAWKYNRNYTMKSLILAQDER